MVEHSRSTALLSIAEGKMMEKLPSSSHLSQNDLYHLGFGGVVYLVSVLSVTAISSLRSKHGAPNPPSFRCIAVIHWAFMAILMFVSMFLDSYYPSNIYLVGWKAAANAYAYAALDYYLSSTIYADVLNCLMGSLGWQAMLQINLYNLRNVWGGDHMMLRQSDMHPLSFLKEYARLGHYLAVVGIFTDLVFSPAHRLTHHKKIYKYLHKGHHAATTQLSGLELYRGELVDTLLMSSCVVIGNYVAFWIVHRVGYSFNMLSNTVWYLYNYFLPQSHASDCRIANLLAPLPEALNFAAYHHVHHVDPALNYGLTVPSDFLWDYILGVKTFVLPSQYQKEAAERKKQMRGK